MCAHCNSNFFVCVVFDSVLNDNLLSLFDIANRGRTGTSALVSSRGVSTPAYVASSLSRSHLVVRRLTAACALVSSYVTPSQRKPTVNYDRSFATQECRTKLVHNSIVKILHKTDSTFDAATNGQTATPYDQPNSPLNGADSYEQPNAPFEGGTMDTSNFVNYKQLPDFGNKKRAF